MDKSSLWSFLLVGLTGCYTYAPVEVHVFDAQTKHPLSGISIAADYPRFMEFFPPKFDHAVTGADGVAVLSVCTNYTKNRGTVWFRLPDDTPYLLDHEISGIMVEMSGTMVEMDWRTVEIPMAVIRQGNGSPYRLDMAVMSIEEHQPRYPNK